MRLNQRWWVAGLVGPFLVGASAAVAQVAPSQEVPPIVVQAVDFTDQGGGHITVHRLGRGASPAYIHEWCTPGHWLEWTIDQADPGDYQLLLRYGEKFQTARGIEINGHLAKALESVVFPSTGSWQTVQDFKAAAPISLPAGKNTLRITCLDEQSLWLYQIRLLRGDKAIVIDPASFTGQGGGQVQAIVSDAHGYFTMWDNRGQAFEWTIPDVTAGVYKLSLCCATRDAAARELRVNGQVVKGFESFIAPWTGGWRNWCEEALPGEVPLKAGRNVLRMTNIEGGLNVSYLRLRAPGTPDILINAIDFSALEGGKALIDTPSLPYVDNWDRAGQWLEWKFKAPAAGAYTITMRYMAPPYSPEMESPADLDVKPRKFELNGSVVKGLEAYMAPGLDLREWREVDLPVVVNLKSGLNVLKLTNMADGPLTLYELRFTQTQNP